jgi:hypothetical protein
MGSAKDTFLEESDRNYTRNRYYHERKKLKDRIQLHVSNPSFVKVLEAELEVIERNLNENKKQQSRTR